jgi:hypothetical protein
MLGLPAATAEGLAPTCSFAAEQGGQVYPVDQLDPGFRCLISAVLDKPTTVGLVGPIQTPVTVQLYDYLLDRPPLVATLSEQLGLGRYQVVPQGPNQFWVNDGDGAEGLLTLLYRDPSRRIYYLRGFHKGRFLPTVRGTAVIFMHSLSISTHEGGSAVETSLVIYTKLDNAVLAEVARVVRPLIREAVTRKLSRGIEVAHRLGAAIAEDPQQIAQLAALVPWLSSPERHTFLAMLSTIPPQTARRLVGTTHSRPFRQ